MHAGQHLLSIQGEIPSGLPPLEIPGKHQLMLLFVSQAVQ